MRLAAQIRSNELEGNDTVDKNVPGAIHDAHAPFTRAGLEPVAAGDDPSQHRVLRLTGDRHSLRVLHR
jgi:hypothetical protein